MSDNEGIKCDPAVLIDLIIAMTNDLGAKIEELDGDVGTVLTASMLAIGKYSSLLAVIREKRDGVPVAKTGAQLINIFRIQFCKDHGDDVKLSMH